MIITKGLELGIRCFNKLTLEGRRKENNAFTLLRGKDLQPQILYLTQRSLRVGAESRHFQSYEDGKHFTSLFLENELRTFVRKMRNEVREKEGRKK